jgi:chemotaxis protein MotA
VKLDLGTWLGMAAAFGFILLGNYLEGGHMSSILQPTAAMIVFGGTLGAVMVSFPLDATTGAVKALGRVFCNQRSEAQALLDDIQRFAHLARKEGIIALENEARSARHPFLKKALLTIVDGVDSKSLEKTLDVQIGEIEERGETPAKVFEAGGGYSPTIGIIGAVLGLIHVMANLSDVAKVGEGIAVAFVATIYGVGLANIVLLPAANKLKLKHHEDVKLCEMIKEGALGIQVGENPRQLVERLLPFVHTSGAGHAESKTPAPAGDARKNAA